MTSVKLLFRLIRVVIEHFLVLPLIDVADTVQCMHIAISGIITSVTRLCRSDAFY